MMWWDDGGASTASWIVMSVSMIIFWGGLIALVVWLVHGVGRGSTSSLPTPPVPPPSDANEVLAQRFARGAINDEEFLHRRAVLRSVAGGIPSGAAPSEWSAEERS